MSNLIAGIVVAASGFDAGFLAPAGIAAVGAVSFAVMMPETGPA